MQSENGLLSVPSRSSLKRTEGKLCIESSKTPAHLTPQISSIKQLTSLYLGDLFFLAS
jgi:hypothetical protein